MVCKPPAIVAKERCNFQRENNLCGQELSKPGAIPSTSEDGTMVHQNRWKQGSLARQNLHRRPGWCSLAVNLCAILHICSITSKFIAAFMMCWRVRWEYIGGWSSICHSYSQYELDERVLNDPTHRSREMSHNHYLGSYAPKDRKAKLCVHELRGRIVYQHTKRG